MFEFKNVDFSYNKEQIFHNLNIQIEQGEYVLVLGSNGSGKSTFVQCLLGLLQPNKGTIAIEGKSTKNFSEWDKIGYVAQRVTHIEMAIPTSVKEVVAMGNIGKITLADIIEQLDIVGMSEYLHADIHNLSGGQQQRVFIARALMSNPNALILDEPTVGLDAQTTHNFYELVAQLHKRGKTIIMITHDMHLLTKEATRIIEINRGISFDGNLPDYRQWHDTHCLYCEDTTSDETKEEKECK